MSGRLIRRVEKNIHDQNLSMMRHMLMCGRVCKYQAEIAELKLEGNLTDEDVKNFLSNEESVNLRVQTLRNLRQHMQAARAEMEIAEAETLITLRQMCHSRHEQEKSAEEKQNEEEQNEEEMTNEKNQNRDEKEEERGGKNLSLWMKNRARNHLQDLEKELKKEKKKSKQMKTDIQALLTVSSGTWKFLRSLAQRIMEESISDSDKKQFQELMELQRRRENTELPHLKTIDGQTSTKIENLEKRLASLYRRFPSLHKEKNAQ